MKSTLDELTVLKSFGKAAPARLEPDRLEPERLEPVRLEPVGLQPERLAFPKMAAAGKIPLLAALAIGIVGRLSQEEEEEEEGVAIANKFLPRLLGFSLDFSSLKVHNT